jgi:hypothetical protein
MRTTFSATLLRLKNLLNNKKAALLCCGAGIVGKSLIAFFYSDLSADKSLYLLFTQSLLNTGVLAEPIKVFETGGAAYVYDPAIHSPLYSFLCAPFLWLTHSFFATQFIVSFLSWVLFFTALYRVALLLFKAYWRVSIVLLFAAFFLYCHELSSGPKDTLAVGFTLWAAVFARRFLHSSADWKITFPLAVLLSCMCLVKLLYIPLAASLLFLLLVFTGLKKSTAHFRQAVLLLGLLFLFGFLMYWLAFRPAYHLAAVSTIHLPIERPYARGFYPRNLLITYPFVSASFVDTNFWIVQLVRFVSIPLSAALNVFRIVDVLLLAAISLVVFSRYRRLFQNKLMVFFTAASVTMVAVVAYLSVTQETMHYSHGLGQFNFVVDARSFLMPMLTLQLASFLFLFYSPRFIAVKCLLLALFFVSFVHGVYFDVKTVLTSPLTPEAKANTQAFKKIGSLLSENKQLALVTPNNALRRYAQVHGLPAYAFTNLNPPQEQLANSRFLVAIYPEDSAFLKKFPVQKLLLRNTVFPFVLYEYDGRQ